MFLLLVRHAIAEDRVEFAHSGQPDGLRPLSGEGRKKMRPIAEALRDLLPEADLLLASPLLRARQTAQILAGVLDLPPAECEALAPDAEPAAFFRFLRGRPSARATVAVGHEPSLSLVAGWALLGRAESLFALKKGGACLLEMGPGWRAGSASLLWLLQPAQLRRLAAK